MENCIFCKILGGDIPSECVYEDDDCIIINDIAPKAKLHYLMIPKEHYPLLDDLDEKRAATLARMLLKLKELRPILNLEEGYRLVVNQGEYAGQTVPHLHIHILGGEPLPFE